MIVSKFTPACTHVYIKRYVMCNSICGNGSKKQSEKSLFHLFLLSMQLWQPNESDNTADGYKHSSVISRTQHIAGNVEGRLGSQAAQTRC